MAVEMRDNEWVRGLADFEVAWDHPNRDIQAFHLFFARFLSGFQQEVAQLLERLERESRLQVEKEIIIPEIVDSLESELSSLSIRTLIYEINEKRILGLLQGDTPEQRYEYYHSQFLNHEPFFEILNKYPVLYDLILQLIQGRLRLIGHALIRLAQDQERIRADFGKDFAKITRIRITSGDTHNDGQKVLSISTDTGKFLYKPHSLSTDCLWNALVDFMNEQGGLRTRIHYVTSIDRGSYGWQDYVEAAECGSTQEVAAYYYRLGVNLALLHTIGATDIHFENLISAGEHPYIVDLETLIENKTMEAPYTGSLVEEFNRMINESVLGTAVLPLNFKNSIFDFDMSAMSSMEEQTSDFWKMFVVLNNFTDEIKLERLPGTIGRASNFVVLNGEKVEPYLYIEDLLEGFEDGYRLICEHKQEFKDGLTSYCGIHPVTVRQVLKPTSIYAKFLEASSHPVYLKSAADRLNLLSKLKTRKDQENPKILLQREYEISALFQCDIPYFTTTMNSRDLECNNKGSIPDYFNLTLMDIIMNRLNRISLDQLETQLFLIRSSLSTSVTNNWLREPAGSFPRLNRQIPYFKSGSNYVEYARGIGDHLSRMAVWNKEGTACTWLAQLIDKERLRLGALNYFLYEGGGVILFLYTLAKETGEDRYFKLAEAGLRGIEDQLDGAGMKAALSSFNGVGSLIYLYYTVYRMFGDMAAYAKYGEQLDYLLKETDLTGHHELDYVSGVSGLVTLLLNIYDQEQDSRLLEICKPLGEYLYQGIKDREGIALAGLSHGWSGAALALLKLAACLEEEDQPQRYKDLALRLLTQENEHYSQEKGNWRDLRTGEEEADPVYWCHGASGIALSRAEMLKIAEPEDRPGLEADLRLGIQKLLSDGFSPRLDHSLCHGVFGNLDILVTAGKSLGEAEWTRTAHTEAARALEQIKASRVICGLSNAFDLLSFMVGLTGIGYTLLRLNNNRLPSVLAMEIYH
ncbi:type 2 lanthipeptide synthetase LanM family protein [Paenibacillus sp. J22TS3]|uniref:type 2 lanthipeptide synthetase LanM family protein n=1 Tax=Paenibacillus sp. J22TS3 TaxID=2807192 RepID=UPI001B0893B4|nr:type 2 lanthipeptide synthetase LanM family protein [Paenibacillus sp. J22TS3]GIP23443.1 bacteriocin formation protein [Paenibacillus sp. J22TS3]